MEARKGGKEGNRCLRGPVVGIYVNLVVEAVHAEVGVCEVESPIHASRDEAAVRAAVLLRRDELPAESEDHNQGLGNSGRHRSHICNYYLENDDMGLSLLHGFANRRWLLRNR